MKFYWVNKNISYIIAMLRIGRVQFYLYTYPVWSICNREINMGYLAIRLHVKDFD